MTTSPLLKRELTDSIAYVTKELSTLQCKKGFISVDVFLSHVMQLSEMLPRHSFVINLCGNRYLFLVSFCAALISRQTSLLPPNKNVQTQQSLANRYPDSYIISDEEGFKFDSNLKQFDLTKVIFDHDAVTASEIEIPEIESTFRAVIAFTSGSTGSAKPNLKHWRTLYLSSQINVQHMLDGLEYVDETHYQLATVPSQHMWGFETSVLMPLFANICVCDVSPLFPKNIESLLLELPEPRMLVSAPVHLRALNSSELDLPKVNRVLCATAPLTKSLAQSIEHSLKASLVEVYGCSEVGSMASRLTAKEVPWHLFDGIFFNHNKAKAVTVSAEHLTDIITIEDVIKLDDSGRSFTLMGRSSDMIEIGGKRGSLQEMNAILMKAQGLIDGVVFFPQQNKNVPRLVAFVVLESSEHKQSIADVFKQSVDPVFVPRPILEVKELPRHENGKLSQASLLEMYRQYIKKTND